ncbi:MAG: response regulator [Bacteroidales bacterium]|nr:response regulator [Bacteroidales bacterium]
MKILLLEDNPSDADLTKRSLIGSVPDCTIEHASTVDQARKLLITNPIYDIALLDVNLPDGNGLKFLTEIRQQELNFPVIMLTGSGDEDAAVTALKAGADDYIVKRSGYVLYLPDIISSVITNFKENDLYKSDVIHVLYIEHHAVDIDFTIRHLAQYAPNIQIDAVSTGEEALSKLEIETTNKVKYQVILMDYRLPGMNALELIKAIRQNFRLSIPIILVTGQGNEELAVQALKLGANDYLTKSEKYLYRLPSVIVNSYQHCELKRKQEALVESESKYRLLADNSGDVIFVLDMDLNYTYISPAVKVLRGFEPEEAIKQKLSEVLTPASYQKAAKVISEILSENLSSLETQVLQKTIELEMIRKDKTTIWTEVKASLITEKNNNPVGIIGVTRDISERKSIMDKLRKLSRAVEQSPALIVITDTKGNIEYVNPKFTEITGYSLQEVLGKNSRILKSGYTNKSEYKNLWNTISSGSEWKGIFHNKRKDGSLYWEEASITSIKTPDGKITHFLAVKSDITEKKKIFDELIIAKEKAEESDNLKTAFLHNISHEIRTPLNAIVGFSSIIGNSELQAKKRKEFLNVILMSNDQLLSIISGIIALATLEAGQEQILEKETDINELLSNVYEQFRISSIKPEVTFSFHPALPDELAIIYTDPVKLMQILGNLVGNALKFTHKGFVRFGYRLVNQKLEFFVEDTGIGISPEMHEIVFERFRQIDNSPTRLYGGTGLGLALSKGYVELLGGEIQLKSEPGKGSVFTFVIPYKPVNQIINNVRKKEEGDLAILSPGWTILVAEDEHNNFLLINELLDMMKLNTIRAENGHQAVSICSEEVLPDLVLMDIKMPEMDGIEATSIIKKQHPHLPVIALTAYVLDPDRKRIMDAGCDDYIEKPVKQKVLYETLTKYLK